MTTNPLITTSSPSFQWRGVHLDLKGLAPTPQRLLGLLETISFAGYNMVLVEWEDMFPWQVDKNFQNAEAYDQKTLDSFYKRAKELEIEVVPLVQTLGHMETFLRCEKYHHLREVENKSDVINPLAKGAQELVTALVDEIARRTPDIKYLHLGGDEAWSFGSHPDTKEFIKQNSKAKLFLKHIEPVLDNLASKNIRPILWHDMMIEWDDDAIKRVGEKADIMGWGYRQTPDESSHHYSTKYLKRFYENGAALWGAGAYKGADGTSADIPDLAMREHNALGWVKTGKQLNMKGMIATAWSRYSTNRMQCEPIAGSLDALFFVGAIFHNGCAINSTSEKAQQDLAQALKNCNENQRFENCHKILSRLSKERQIAWNYVQMQVEQKTLDNYHHRQDSLEISEKTGEILQSHIKNIENMESEMQKVFDGLLSKQTITEYMQTRTDALKNAAK